MATSETAGEIIAKNKKGAINREFPSDMRNKTLEEINKLARKGNKDAKKAKKLLRINDLIKETIGSDDAQ